MELGGLVRSDLGHGSGSTEIVLRTLAGLVPATLLFAGAGPAAAAMMTTGFTVTAVVNPACIFSLAPSQQAAQGAPPPVSASCTAEAPYRLTVETVAAQGRSRPTGQGGAEALLQRASFSPSRAPLRARDLATQPEDSAAQALAPQVVVTFFY